ncbi:iron permease FTR1/Fip1/EfeU [Scleroderma yunnanense]
MTQNLFSLTIFFVVLRETLEAAIIISVLLGLVNQIVHEGSKTSEEPSLASTPAAIKYAEAGLQDPILRSKVARRMKMQILLGSVVGLVIALAIGGAFVAVWFTQATNLWTKAEQVWEGVFQLVAALMIFVMGTTMLKMDRARATWRVKLSHAFSNDKANREGRSGKWILFILPLITVLREGMEGVIFVGGVAIGQPASSVPIAAITGVICGLIFGFLIYHFASHSTLRIFLVVMTNLILLVGAGLFSKAAWAFQENAFQQIVGASIDDTGGTGPGSYDVRGNVWHLNCCSPGSGGWQIFNGVLGWQNSATLGSVLAYVFYWLAVIVTLICLKFKEGRTTLFGFESSAGKRRREARERTAEAVSQKENINAAADMKLEDEQLPHL